AGDVFRRYCDPFTGQTPLDRSAALLPDTLAPARFTDGSRSRGAMEPPHTVYGSASPINTWEQLFPMNLGSNASNMIVDPVRDRLVLCGQAEFPEWRDYIWTRPLSDDSTPWS